MNHLKEIANTVRGLSIDAIQKANSGHPGLPMGMADVATVLFNEHLRFNPKNPNWFNRDRFVLSGGHGSMLLYSLLHLYGYDLSLDDIKQFRQWGSRTAGHPEYKETPGVETTTGPLGQGIGNAVGLAMAEAILEAKYGNVVNHFTYVMAGDGDMQEGISHEVCSFAGHNKLNKLIAFYDSNNITIDGDTSLSYSEDTSKRFESYGWDVQEIDGHNYEKINSAILKAKLTKSPSLIICKTTIGFGSPNKAGTSDVHGAPLGAEEILLTKETLGMPKDEFYVSNDVYEITSKVVVKGDDQEVEWNKKFDGFLASNPELGKEIQQRINGEICDFEMPEFETGNSMASRASSSKVLEKIVPNLPSLIGGSADLGPSNKTKVKASIGCSAANMNCNYIHYGVREFAMGAIMNGLAIHGGFIPYGGTFFVFSDYMRSSIRMAALMGLKVIYVFTHDSIGVGEDGPTHQPVEHLAALRVIPNLTVFRPADANETAAGWEFALNHNGPTALVLTRQNLKTMEKSGQQAEKGAYIVCEDEQFEMLIMASGSEVEIALEAKKLLNQKGTKVRVVSMPSMELFEKQSEEYRNSVLPVEHRNRIAVEAASSQSWYKYVGLDGEVIGMDRFGASAPAELLFEKFGFTAENIVTKAEVLLSK